MFNFGIVSDSTFDPRIFTKEIPNNLYYLFLQNIGQSSQSHATRRGGVSGTGVNSNHNDTRQSNGYNSSTSNTSTSSATPPFLHNNNGQLPGIFRPSIDEVAKTHIAQNLANFLQNVYTKNKSSQQQCGPPFRSS